MKKRLLAVLLAAVMVTGMAACGDNSGDSGERPVIRVSGGMFGDLNESNAGGVEYEKKWEFMHQIEDKYNITVEYTNLEGDDGWSTQEMILAGITSGEAYADIFCQGDDIVVGLREYLEDITSDADQLKIGSIYLEPGVWAGHTYGWTYDNMGSAYVMCYSRDYLKSIGMDKTPTDMFEEGKWSYDDCREYLTELKSKLPNDTYPMGVHTNHWASMAPAANGVVSVDSNGEIHLDDPAYCSALDFYKDLLAQGLAHPITDVYPDPEGSGGLYNTQTYGLDTLSRPGNPGTHVLTMVEAWQMGGLLGSIGEWGIVPWPWDPQYVSISGDYTTLSDSYKVPQSIWTDVLVPKAEYRSEGAKKFSGIELHMIAKDYIDLCQADGAKARLAMYEAEQAGQDYVNLGYNPGSTDTFCTPQDIAIYDWLHSRAVVDWGHAMQSNGFVLVNRNAAYVIAAGDDSRSSGQSFKSSGDAAMKDAGFK